MPEPDQKMQLHPRVVGGVVLAALVLLFVVENTKKTTIRFFVPEVTAPLWVGLAVAALLGAVVGALIIRHLGAPRQPRDRGRSKQRKRSG
jgi:uncharacterized integral membrane protein